MIALLLSLLLIGPDVSAMRCGNLLVQPGANKLEVTSRCGEPHYRERVSGSDASSEEVWIYDRPQRNEQKLLHFKGVTLAAIVDAAVLERHAGESLRCDGRLMHAGVTKLTVTKHCGKPDLVERTSGEEQVSREVWMYDRGDVIAELHFTGVELARVVTRAR